MQLSVSGLPTAPFCAPSSYRGSARRVLDLIAKISLGFHSPTYAARYLNTVSSENRVRAVTNGIQDIVRLPPSTGTEGISFVLGSIPNRAGTIMV